MHSYHRWCLAAVLGASLAATATPASAQSLTAQLSDLLVEQAATPGVPGDVAAAELTRDAIADLFSVELASMPASSSSGGFVYRLNRQLGAVERLSDAFGPFYSESVLRPGKAQTGVSVRYHRSHFTSLQGADLTNGTFPTTASRVVGAAVPFSVDTLDFSLDAQTLSMIGTRGLTDRWSVGAVVPFQSVSFRGRRTREADGRSVLQSSQSGRSSGVGDIALQTRYRVVDRGNTGLSMGADVRLPTGRSADLLGAGKTAGRILGIASVEEGRLALHVNGTAGVGGVSREGTYGLATTFAVMPRVTLIGEWLGRYVSQLSRLEDVYQPFVGVPGVETMRWVPVERGIHSSFAVLGAKWNIARSVLVNANVLIRINQSGFRAPVTPMLSLDWDVQR